LNTGRIVGFVEKPSEIKDGYAGLPRSRNEQATESDQYQNGVFSHHTLPRVCCSFAHSDVAHRQFIGLECPHHLLWPKHKGKIKTLERSLTSRGLFLTFSFPKLTTNEWILATKILPKVLNPDQFTLTN
jgi:hypothetical protein